MITHFSFITVCPSTQTGLGCKQCLPGFTGKDCQKCEFGFYDFPDCKGNYLLVNFNENIFITLSLVSMLKNIPSFLSCLKYVTV